MTQETAIIIAAVISSAIAVGAMFATFAFTSRSNERQRKYDSKERFFYEIYQRRLALYEDVLKTLTVMGKPESDLEKMPKQEFYDKVVGDFHTLLVFSNRLFIYGSPKTRGVLAEAAAQMKEIHKELQRGPGVEIEILCGNLNKTPMAHIVDSFILLVNGALAAFASSVREETETDFVDKRINEISKGFSIEEKHQKKQHRKNGGPIDKLIAKKFARVRKSQNVDDPNADAGAT
jgi:hypothetical protein